MPEGRPLTRRQEILLQEEYCACFTIPVLFWLLASLTIIMGFYGTKSMVLGPSYSHLVEANPLFVSGIQFQAKANHREGLVLYSFSEKPILGFQSVWNESLSVSLRPEHHQEFSLWLNKGSRLRLTCFIKSSGFYSVIMTVSQGHNGLQKWLKHPSNRHATASWTGQVGDLEYEVQQDGDYFITIRNLNQQIVEIEFQLDVNATLYELESAYSKCSFAEESCEVQLPLWGKRYALLTSPASENGAKTSEVELVYNARWTSYYSVLIAILIFVSALLKVVKKFDLHIPEPSDQIAEEGSRDPLLSPKATQAALGPYADLLASEWDHGNAYDPQLCAVCLDASKAVFFIPCGHCATCLPCGKRIQHSDSGTCPICRVKIEKVKRVVQP